MLVYRPVNPPSYKRECRVDSRRTIAKEMKSVFHFRTHPLLHRFLPEGFLSMRLPNLLAMAITIGLLTVTTRPHAIGQEDLKDNESESWRTEKLGSSLSS